MDTYTFICRIGFDWHTVTVQALNEPLARQSVQVECQQRFGMLSTYLSLKNVTHVPTRPSVPGDT